jgi:hypothetical protein
MIIWYLIAMIILGILGAALSLYGKNYYLQVFDDILGREEDEKVETRLGRGFIYGFFFPIYFGLLLWGIAALVAFLIAAGIIAAIVFVLVWISEKLLPHEWSGGIMLGLFDKVGLKGAVVPVEETKTVIPVPSEPVATEQPPPPPPPTPSEEPPKPEGAS